MTLNELGVAVLAVREKTFGRARVAMPTHLMPPHWLPAGRRKPGMATIAAATAMLAACGTGSASGRSGSSDTSAAEQASLVAQGKQIFRFDIFDDETRWTDTLRLHEVIRTAVDPTTALAVGLKVDSELLLSTVVQGIQNQTISLTDAAATVALIKLDAVVGIEGTVEAVNSKDTLARVGVTCALRHSTVDNAFAPGIGKRLDGWPSRQLNPGAIIALSPALSAAQKAVHKSGGPGKYDPRFNLDGKNGPQVIPPAYGLQGINKIISTGDGNDLAYWNRYVGVTRMGGHGSFAVPRVGANGVNVTHGTDAKSLRSCLPCRLISFRLRRHRLQPATLMQQPGAPGKLVFNNAGKCLNCHAGNKSTDANTRLNPSTDAFSKPEPNGAPSHAARSATKQYRTAPLAGLWQHPPYFHNGTAATLEAVVQTYNTKQALGLSPAQADDLVRYLKSL